MGVIFLEAPFIKRHANMDKAIQSVKEFILPNKKKIILALGICMGLVATILLRMIPPQFDILDLHEIPGLLAIPFGRWPIQFFDMITASQFASKGEGFLVFPSLGEILFMLVFDIFMIYLVACLFVMMKKKKGESHVEQ